MSQLLAFKKALVSRLRRSVVRLKYHHTYHPWLEAVEARIVLSTVVHDPSYDIYAYQPLNSDTSYNISGHLGSPDSAIGNTYGFFEPAGNTFTVSANLSLTDSPSGGFSIDAPDGSSLYGQSGNISPQSFTATSSGVYTISVGISNIDVFNPSGDYSISLSGTLKPGVVVDTDENSGDLYISTDPSMPYIDTYLTMTPDPKAPLPVSWTAQVKFVPTDDPHALSLAASTLTMHEQSSDTSVEFSPSDAPGGQIQGGRLTVSASAMINGTTQTWTTSTTPDGQNNLMILGDDPTQQEIDAYITSHVAIPSIDNGGTLNFRTMVSSIASGESSYLQFLDTSGQGDGLPTFSLGNDDGSGLMQITPKSGKPPAQQDLWNWQTNIQDGVTLLAGDMEQAQRHLRNDLTTISAQYDLTGITVPTLTPDILLVSAVSLYGPKQNSSAHQNYYYDYTYISDDGSGNPAVTFSITPNPYVDQILKIYNGK